MGHGINSPPDSKAAPILIWAINHDVDEHIRRLTCNVKRWRDVNMALRWTAVGMLEAQKGQSLQAIAEAQSGT